MEQINNISSNSSVIHATKAYYMNKYGDMSFYESIDEINEIIDLVKSSLNQTEINLDELLAAIIHLKFHNKKIRSETKLTEEDYKDMVYFIATYLLKSLNSINKLDNKHIDVLFNSCNKKKLNAKSKLYNYVYDT